MNLLEQIISQIVPVDKTKAPIIQQRLDNLTKPQGSLGRLEVRQTFKVGRRGMIAGCIVNEGVINRDAHLRLLRDNIIIRDDCEVDSLRRFKDDVREVRAGLECGLRLAGFDDIKVGDVLEAYEEVEIERTL